MPAAALFVSSNECLAAGDFNAAATLLREALRLAPEFPEAHANLALVLERLGQLDDAEASYRQALALAPRAPEILINYAGLLAARRRHADAEVLYLAALQADPGSLRAWTHFGVLLATGKREIEAEQCYRTAPSLDPDAAEARFNLAYLLLRQGRYAEGWPCLEARDWYAPIERSLGLPRWQGESLVGKALLIGLEAGHGDMIQFCRYVPLLKAAGARRVSVLCHPPLARLLRTLPGVDEVLAVGDPAPAESWDYWSPPLSLPYHLQTRVETIPADLPYLAAESALIAKWAARMADGSGKRVGLVWKGNPRFANDGERSLPSLPRWHRWPASLACVSIVCRKALAKPRRATPADRFQSLTWAAGSPISPIPQRSSPISTCLSASTPPPPTWLAHSANPAGCCCPITRPTGAGWLGATTRRGTRGPSACSVSRPAVAGRR